MTWICNSSLPLLSKTFPFRESQMLAVAILFFWPADDDALRVKPPEQPSKIGFLWMRPKANQNLRYILGFLILGTCQCELTFWVRKN